MASRQNPIDCNSQTTVSLWGLVTTSYTPRLTLNLLHLIYRKTILFSLVIYVIKSDNSQAYILPLTIRLHKMFVIYNVLQGSYADKKNLHFNYNSY